jgi:hypothetical protein
MKTQDTLMIKFSYHSALKNYKKNKKLYPSLDYREFAHAFYCFVFLNALNLVYAQTTDYCY